MPAIKRMESWTVCWSVITVRMNDHSSGILTQHFVSAEKRSSGTYHDTTIRIKETNQNKEIQFAKTRRIKKAH